MSALLWLARHTKARGLSQLQLSFPACYNESQVAPSPTCSCVWMCISQKREGTRKKAGIPWWPSALGHQQPLHSRLNCAREPREETHVVLETCACLFQSTPSHLTTPSSPLYSPPVQELPAAEKGEKEEETHHSLPNPSPTPRAINR